MNNEGSRSSANAPTRSVQSSCSGRGYSSRSARGDLENRRARAHVGALTGYSVRFAPGEVYVGVSERGVRLVGRLPRPRSFAWRYRERWQAPFVGYGRKDA